MILILTQCFPSRQGGIENLVSNLALNLGKENKVIVFADRHNFLYDSIYDNGHKNTILIKRYSGFKFFRTRRKVKDLKIFIQSKKVKIVIADTWKSLELCIDYLNRYKIKTICLSHGNELLSNDKIKENRIKITLDKTSRIITNSYYTSNLLNNIIKDIDKIKIINPGANDLRSLNADNFIKISGNPILLTLARLEKRKGHELILEALTKLIKTFPNIKYFIAGEGIEKNNINKLIIKYKLENNVELTGLINDRQKKYLFENTNLMVMPTLDQSSNRSIEGFGISYIEAAFFGIPSIASSYGGSKESVLHEKTGIVLKKNDNLHIVLKNLLLDKEKMKKLGENALKRAVSEFKWETVLKKYYYVINE